MLNQALALVVRRTFASTVAALALGGALLATAACGNGDARPQVITVPAAVDVAKRGTMTVTGTATLQVSPDCADLSMTVSVEAPRPGPAATGAQTQQKALVSALRAAGVEGGDIKLSELRLDPVYQDSLERISSPKIIAYRGAVTVVVTTKKLDRIGALMEVGANAGVTAMSSELRRSDMPELKKKVRDMALLAAKDKAAQTAKTLDIKLGRVVNVTEAPIAPSWGRTTYANYLGNNVGSMPSSDQALGGTMQPLTLDVTLELDLPQS